MKNISLDVISVKSPCEVPWNEMAGDHNVRFCKHCTQNVYDISALTRAEAEELINTTEGRLCVRYYVRPDNTIITADCAPKPQPRFPRTRRLASRVLALLGLTTLAGLATGVRAEGPPNAVMGGAPLRIDIRGEVVAPPNPPTTRPAPPKDKYANEKTLFIGPPMDEPPDCVPDKDITNKPADDRRQMMGKIK